MKRMKKDKDYTIGKLNELFKEELEEITGIIEEDEVSGFDESWYELTMSMPKLPEISSKKDIPILEDMIKIQEKLAKIESHKYATNDKMYMSDPENRHLYRLKTLKEFLLTDQKIELDYANTSGLILINNKYIASLSNNKWRVKGKNKWYWYKTPQQLVDKYILR